MCLSKLKPHKIYADPIDGKALAQFYEALKQPYVVKAAAMADMHAGYSLPIGGVVATEGMVVPAWVGYDIGCGVGCVLTSFKKEDVVENSKAIFDGIYKAVPVGFAHNKAPSTWDAHKALPKTEFMERTFAKNGLFSLATTGGGNHFFSCDYDELGRIWLVIHSGSRNIGAATAKHYMQIASGSQKAKEGHYPLDVNSAEGQDYIKDMNFCLAFALENRRQIIERVERVIQQTCYGEVLWDTLINRNHNHAEEKDGLWIHRKGATHAEADMLGCIPGTMRDGSFIVEGKGCEDSLCSSSHGAGRVMSRKEAKRTISLEEFQNSMEGIVARVEEATLDEAPQSYKDIFTVMEQQKDLVSVKHHIKTLINIKG